MAMPRRHQRGRRNGEADHRSADRTPTAPAPTDAAPLDRANRWRDTLLHAAIIVLAVLWIYSPVYHARVNHP